MTIDTSMMTINGVVLAVISGGITSGLGYACWYVALTGLSVNQAAVVQLSVPVIAAFGGILFLSETINMQLIVSTLLVIGGIWVSSLASKKRK